jgi:molybdate/tungstate transport system ATP-binding protein
MIACDGLALEQGAFRLSSLALSVPAGSYAVLMGGTGCGKTTVLEALCGLRRVRAGRIQVGGREVSDLPPGARGLGYVPQDGALFPTMDVAAHLAFAPRIHRWPAAAIAARVRELADLLAIGHLLPRRVQALSGGERQRVALGRALAARPSALLLDEPLAALDDRTRDELIAVLAGLGRQRSVTILHVTHSRHEAEALGQVRLRMEGGAIVAEGP